MCKVLLGVHNLFHWIISFVSQYYRLILSNQVLLHRRQVCRALDYTSLGALLDYIRGLTRGLTMMIPNNSQYVINTLVIIVHDPCLYLFLRWALDGLAASTSNKQA